MNKQARGAKSKSVSDDVSHFLITNFDDCAILAWQGFHWCVVKSMEENDGHIDALYCLDPGTLAARNVRLDTRDPVTNLYFFKKDPDLLEKVEPLVNDLLEHPVEEKKKKDISGEHD